ncbi:hypothetical protein AB0469_03390 [Streptomyces sp. NPDC093801]|uniref:hypothetical protein n=1 Tax=Streptomyces sp. NPDC093801 TaxID=3155203 RepID=UPI00344BB0AE
MTTTATTHRVRVLAAPGARHGEILTARALAFVGRLAEAFGERRRLLLKERRRQAIRLATGSPPDFPIATSAVRADPTWRVAPPAPGLEDRRVEITGPPERCTAVNALNSGAGVRTADFADATAPTWNNIVGGQPTLLDATRRRIDFTTPEGEEYRLGEQLPTVVVRPRGWHLLEEHLEFDGRPVPASLVDFGLYFFHCAQRQIDAGRGPYFYLPKQDTEREAEDGFDGSLVAHPGLVPVCRDVFDGVLAGRPHQLDRTREDVQVGAADLLSVRRTGGPPTEQGVRTDIAVALRYFDAWLHGRGAVALGGLMEDAATAEIARVQIWQWLRHRALDRDTVTRILDEELAALGAQHPWAAVDEVRELFERTALAGELPLFFTPDAYTRHLVRIPEAHS